MSAAPGAFIPFPEPRALATFVGRRKRFFADMLLLSGEPAVAHCPNTGSMRTCLLPGARAVLWDANSPKRRLRYSWKAVEGPDGWIGIDTLLPNRLVEAALRAGELPALGAVAEIERERPMGEGSRVDLLVTGKDGSLTYVEVKNVTLVEHGRARFPDAVTARGLKHLRELGAQVRRGHRAAMVYVIQREDGRSFEPAADIDPGYAQGLREALAAGVQVFALGTQVTVEGVRTAGLLPVAV